MIEVKNLYKNYGKVEAVKGVSFKVEKGEVVGLLGPNAAGKTTIMRIITGYLAPTSGYVKVCDYDVIEDAIAVKRNIGYLPENLFLYDDMRVKEYLGFVAELKCVRRKERRKQINEVIELTHIEEVATRLIGNISRGYKQRVGLAQALINNPEVLILDEPTLGLDPKQIVEVRNLIKELAKKRTVILSSHILPEVSQICPKVMIINEGEIVASDTQENLSKRLTQSDKLLVEIKGSKVKVKDIINQIKGVRSVVIDKEIDERCTYRIEVEPNIDIREELFYNMAREHFPILQLRTLGLSLEEIFMRLTTEE